MGIRIEGQVERRKKVHKLQRRRLEEEKGENLFTSKQRL
jgi:hypothetical protein